jgi:high-affinity iron transporter
MIISALITFRESLEAILIIGIILSYLKKTNHTRYNKIVYVSVALAVSVSIALAYVFFSIAGGFTGVLEEVFEGITMLIGAALLTTMILWMMNQRNVATSLEQKLDVEISEAHKLGIFLLVFVSILREGIELVIFLGAASFVSEESNLLGAIIGMAIAMVIGYLIFVSSRKISLKKFFTITSVLLILFAAGLVAHGIHELQEANVFPIIIEELWNINPPLNPDGTYPLLHDSGLIGSVFKGLFGYNGNPSLLETLSYIIYLLIAILIWFFIDKKKQVVESRVIELKTSMP